ncbi:MAG: TaqI-like C-terminal specificity domain-containing protein [Bacteroidia bacterium]|nr:TaqI-like C-terminal specificity domain-containing protein [Bacteroidia bacterium]
MILQSLEPRKALNKAFLKAKPSRSDIENFKNNLKRLLDLSNESESEEFHKNLVSDFLKNTYYTPDYFINTKGRNDLVIHNGKKANDTVGVIIEAKKPTNKGEMIRAKSLNGKALHELILYYLRERITEKNLEVKQLIITNIYEWFIFDSQVFDKLFANNKKLVKQFADFEAGRLSSTNTDFFYKEIASPLVEEIQNSLPFTYFDLHDYEKPLRNDSLQDDRKLIALFKLFSPEHLLKLPFANDSNSLDRRFYAELLHIIGLEEIKDGGKKLIGRATPNNRLDGSLLENAIIQLESHDKMGRLEKPSQYGSSYEERLFSVALELVITWMNRILFLKLLEAQLLSYHKRDQTYSFLNTSKLRDFDDVDKLFFQVLAKKHDERRENIQQLFRQVPYLNSSLFEPTDLEHKTLFISGLEDRTQIPIHNQSVLKDANGKRLTGNKETLFYLFEFLNAYDFSSEGAEEIQEENKTLINASVLGLIFEKINGYKDGSFFTPGFITEYMCRETIRKAVVRKFKEVEKNDIETYDDLKAYTHHHYKPEDTLRFNRLINSLTICDPAVGSGHFLVSALNELIAIKSDLRILADDKGISLRIDASVVNDELVLSDSEANLFEYLPTDKESQRIQKALFHEKQTLIENCLFGVDINPNSVKICRLRLWIELLKHAYYKFGELETLPNIDINIKCGNSLISRFALDSRISEALKRSSWKIADYKACVQGYKQAQTKEEKQAFVTLIDRIKGNFQTEIGKNDKRVLRLNKLNGEYYNLLNQVQLFEPSEKEKKERQKKRETLENAILSLQTEIDEIKDNRIYENAFEWRFEFPEVLNEEGDFVGFDVVVGNPPYIRQELFSPIKPYLQTNFETFAGTADLFVYFVEQAIKLLRTNGDFVYIIPNKWMRAGYGGALRNFLKNLCIRQIIDFGDLPVFEEATTYPCILQLQKKAPVTEFVATTITSLDFPDGLDFFIRENQVKVISSELSESGWTLVDSKIQMLISKLRDAGTPLGDYVDGKIYRGVLTGYNTAFVIDKTIREELIRQDPHSAEIIKPFLAGRDIKRYEQPKSDKYLIFTRRGINIDKYPAILQYLEQFRKNLEPKPNDYSGNEWPGRKAGSYKWYEMQDAIDYYEEFEKGKIMLPDIAIQSEALLDDSLAYCVNTAYIIPVYDKNLLGILNSRLILFFYANLTSTIRGGYYRFIRQYLEQIPILEPKNSLIEDLVDKIIQLKAQSKDTYSHETEIDRLVYELYGLTEAEIEIVEGVR